MPEQWPAIFAIALVIIGLVGSGCYAVKKRRQRKKRIERRAKE